VLRREISLVTFKGTGLLPGVDLNNSASLASQMSGSDQSTLDRDKALSLLKQAKPYLNQRFGVVDLALFG
jgi:hypothetical protein